jgi:hypothetical protein
MSAGVNAEFQLFYTKLSSLDLYIQTHRPSENSWARRNLSSSAGLLHSSVYTISILLLGGLGAKAEFAV